MADALKDAVVTMEQVGGRTLRVAQWRLDEPSEHLPILFFNGIGANIEAVAPIAHALNDRGFIMFDVPGVGESPEPVVPYNIVTMAWTSAQLLDQLGIDQVDAMGISWGGGIAQHFAIQHADRVRKVTLIATSMGMLMKPGNPASETKMPNPYLFIDPGFMMKNFETLYGEGLGTGPEKDDHMARLKPPTTRGILYQSMAMLGWTSAPALPFLRKPVLVLMGDDDQIVPLINGKWIASLVPNARLKILEGGGHLFLLSHKEECVEAIRDFLVSPANAECGEGVAEAA